MNCRLAALLIFVSLAPNVPAQTSSTYVGQIVCCEECWVSADRKTTPFGTTGDLAKAAECVRNGDPTLLAITDNEGATSFYRLEEGRFKKPGRSWLEWIGTRVNVTGVVRIRKEQRYLRVDSLEVLASPQQIAPGSQVIGTEAELALPDLFGTEQRLSSLRGRIVILNFWATWCGPCVKEMPDLISIQNQYAALGVQVVGATADPLPEQKTVREFITRMKINFPIWLGSTTREMAQFGLGPALPGTAVIGRDGRIVAVYPAVIQEADLRKLLDQLIAQSQGKRKEQIAEIKRAGRREASSVPS